MFPCTFIRFPRPATKYLSTSVTFIYVSIILLVIALKLKLQHSASAFGTELLLIARVLSYVPVELNNFTMFGIKLFPIKISNEQKARGFYVRMEQDTLHGFTTRISHIQDDLCVRNHFRRKYNTRVSRQKQYLFKNTRCICRYVQDDTFKLL